LGCYPDNVSARTLNGFGGTFTGTNTVASCQTDCLNRGFDYAGVEDGVQCFCASSIKGGVIPGGTCTTACSGGGGTCGGVDAIDIYKATVAQCVTPWKYLGCYSDNVSSRILNGFGGTFSTNTVASCQTMCLQRGFNYAGVEDGVQCFCASSLGTSGTLEAESHCQTRCGGGGTYMIPGFFLSDFDIFPTIVGTCGGVDAIGIYKVAT
ncbi:WSC domain-containing protein, partial [Mycena polygramma]